MTKSFLQSPRRRSTYRSPQKSSRGPGSYSPSTSGPLRLSEAEPLLPPSQPKTDDEVALANARSDLASGGA